MLGFLSGITAQGIVAHLDTLIFDKSTHFYHPVYMGETTVAVHFSFTPLALVTCAGWPDHLAVTFF
jgi:hypothetical protein